MLISEVLTQYPEEDLHRLARDKVDEVANLRLPREVLIQEISAALSSLSYVARVLAPARPPTYGFLKLLLEAPEHRVPPFGFRQRVLDFTNALTARAEAGDGLSREKDFRLYLRILFAAWEDDGQVDRSEALILAALRKELGIWMREHLLLEHHPLVRPVWDSDRAYAEARNHLLATGVVLVHDGDFVLPDEVAVPIRRHWEIELSDASYERLLDLLTVEQLHNVLEAASLQVSGLKEERIQRIIDGLIPPAEVLDHLHINEVKDLCRACRLPVSAAKADLIASLIDHFDADEDLQDEPVETEVEEREPEPEERLLSDERLQLLLDELTVDLLYDVLAARGIRRSGSKAERIGRLVDSRWSETTFLNDLRRADLVDLCRKLEIPVSGVKAELIDRLIEWATQPQSPTATENLEKTMAESMVQRTEDEGSEVSDEVSGAPAADGALKPAAAWEEPEDLPWVKDRYPDLEPDEQIVLALLRHARSLTEREIFRAAELHGLGWFLIKGHMADLLTNLGRTATSPVRLRSAGQHNIYEWRGKSGDGASRPMAQETARNLVDALRQGVVPDRYLDQLVVGQEPARKHLIQLLEHVAEGRSAFKFLRGAYGAGKTFLCSWLREQAFERGFAASTVRIGPDQPLSDLPVFFTALVDGLRTPEKRNATALPDLIESWLLAIHRRTASAEGLTAFTRDDAEELQPLVEARIEEEVASLADVDPGFGPAVRAFYRARLERDHATASTALAWLRGSRAMSASSLSALGVRGHLAADEVFPRTQALLRVISGGNLRGLLLVVDELELVRRFPRARQRERAYETLRLLIDECGENDLPGCLLVCTGTEQLFEDEQYGLASYRALAHRVAPPSGTAGRASVRQPIIALEALDGDRLLDVAVKVRDIHGTAYGWPASERVPHSVLKKMTEDWTRFGENQTARLPRPFLREVVHLLDLCEERPDIPAEEFLRKATDAAELAASVLDSIADL